jgi:hypothetical protein
VEAVVFTALAEGVDLVIKVYTFLPFITIIFNVISSSFQTALGIISFLSEIKSPRTDEFQVACNAKFKLSTVFRTSSDLEALHTERLTPQAPTSDNAEVIV